MTVQDFIVIYNETFKFIKDRHGVDALKDFWQTISTQWCTHLDELVREKGLDGMVEYWGGTTGTLGREKAEYEIMLEAGIFKGIMHECPSVGELKARYKKLCSGKADYCDHCQALYRPVANRYGFELLFDIEHDEEGICAGRCAWTSSKIC